MAASTHQKPVKKRFLFLKKIITSGLAICLIIGLSTWYINGKGLDFFNTGKSGVQLLQNMAQDLKRNDIEALKKYYAADYSGTLLGLTEFEQIDDRDGIYISRMRSNDVAPNLNTAIDEWRTYLADFIHIEEAGLYIHRLEEWQDPTKAFTANVRFELIGQSLGASRTGIDRAFFRMHFVPGPQGPLIHRAELIEGERHISAQPHFINVGAQVGIDF